MNPKIKSIRKNNFRYEVTIEKDNDTYVFKISEDLLIESKFFSINKEISLEEFEIFLSKLPLDSLMLIGVKYLDKGLHSVKETKEYLSKKTSSTKLINETIEILKRKNLLNDELYRNSLIDYLINVKKEGRNKIHLSLVEAGLDSSYIDYKKELLIDNIKDLSIKYDLRNKDLPRQKRIDKCKNYLLQKGYTMGEINAFFSPSYIEATDEAIAFKRDKELYLKKYNNDITKVKLALYRKGYSKELIGDIYE